MQKLKPPKRLNLLISLITLLIIAFTIHSCKKDHLVATSEVSTDQAAVQIQQWLKTQKKDSIIAYTVNKLSSQANWKTAHTVTADSGKVYQVVELNIAAKFDDTTKTEHRYLTIIVRNGISTGYLYDIFASKAELLNKIDNLIINFEQKRIEKFTGEITLSSWKNAIKKSKTYSNGVNTITKILISKPAANRNVIQSTRKKLNTCIDWFWEYYRDGVLYDEEYAYTTCDGNENQCDAIGSRDHKGVLTIKLLCGGNEGAGGDPNTADTTVTRVPNTNRLPTNGTTDLQAPNMCVFKVIEWMSKYYGGNVSYFDAYVYYGQYNQLTSQQFSDIQTNGIQTDNLSGFLSHFFSVQQATSTTNMFQQIRNGYPMMGSLVYSDGTGHEIMITGYRADGTCEYFDPQSGTYKFAPPGEIHNVYMILANQ